MATSYRPEIDGLRAIAVIAVVLFHFGIGLPGGFVGVDVFFVISGYLITRLVLRATECDTLSVGVFFERRIRRIFPALFVVVASTLAVGYWMLLPDELKKLGRSSVAQSFGIANIYFWRDTGYFSGPANNKPLLHTWSLAVEEQFYLLLPLVLVFCKSMSRKKVFLILSLVALVSFSASVYSVIYHPNGTFYLLPTRAWELLLGCGLAALPWQFKSQPVRDTLVACIGLVALSLPMFFYNSRTTFPGLAAVPPVIGTALIIFASSSTPSIWPCKLLSLRPAVFLGLISYSLYLWHWPIIVFTRMYFGDLHWQQLVLALSLSLALSFLTWKWVEMPFRHSVLIAQRKRVFRTALTMNVAVVSISATFIASGGLPKRFPDSLNSIFVDTYRHGAEYVTDLSDRLDFAVIPKLGIEPVVSIDNARPDFIVWGDSHASAISSVIDDVASELHLSGRVIAVSGLPGIPNIYRISNERPGDVESAWQSQVMALLREQKPRVLILVSRWSFYTDGGNSVEDYPDGHHVIADGNEGLAAPTAPEEVLARNLLELADFCRENQISLWVVKQVPELKVADPAGDLYRYSAGRRRELPVARSAFTDHLVRQSKPESIFQRVIFKDVKFLDPAPLLLDHEGNVTSYINGKPIYRDDDHLSRLGCEMLRPMFLDAMSRIRSFESLSQRGIAEQKRPKTGNLSAGNAPHRGIK
jgi:peptidoglycan/LPS O-acetylase OafA/YrhL